MYSRPELWLSISSSRSASRWMASRCSILSLTAALSASVRWTRSSGDRFNSSSCCNSFCACCSHPATESIRPRRFFIRELNSSISAMLRMHEELTSCIRASSSANSASRWRLSPIIDGLISQLTLIQLNIILYYTAVRCPVQQ